eukprot:SAG31_NODE_1276_length_9044_cov_10.002236_4_plen_82_part_00
MTNDNWRRIYITGGEEERERDLATSCASFLPVQARERLGRYRSRRGSCTWPQSLARVPWLAAAAAAMTCPTSFNTIKDIWM